MSISKRSTEVNVKPTPEELRERYRRHRRFVRIGQVLMLIGLLVAVQHWLAHLGIYGAQPPGWIDLVAGYPIAAVLILIGAMTAGNK